MKKAKTLPAKKQMKQTKEKPLAAKANKAEVNVDLSLPLKFAKEALKQV